MESEMHLIKDLKSLLMYLETSPVENNKLIDRVSRKLKAGPDDLNDDFYACRSQSGDVLGCCHLKRERKLLFSTVRRQELLPMVGHLTRHFPDLTEAEGPLDVITELVKTFGSDKRVKMTPFNRKTLMLLNQAPAYKQVASGHLDKITNQSGYFEELLELIRQFCRTTLGRDPDFERIVAEIECSEKIFYGWFDEGILTAIAGFTRQVSAGRCISFAYTPEPYRRRGYAQSLISRMCRDLFGLGKVSFLYVEQANERALSLYKKIGFTSVQEWADIKFDLNI